MSDADEAEPKASPLRVPVMDVPVRNSLMAPDAASDSVVPAEERPSVIPQPVRVVSDPPRAANGQGDAVEAGEEELLAELEDDAPLELSPMEASVEGAAQAASESAEPAAHVEADIPEPAALPSIDPADTLELDPDADGESIEPSPRPSAAQPPPPPATASASGPPTEGNRLSDSGRPSAATPPPPPPPSAASAPVGESGRPSVATPPPPPAVDGNGERPSAAQPPPPPTSFSGAPPRVSTRPAHSTVDLDLNEIEEAGASERPSRTTVDIDVTEEEDAQAVLIDLTHDDEPDVAAATAVPGAEAVEEPSSAGRMQSAPPQPPTSRGPSGAAAHRVADLKPSKPRKQHWWETFFNDDYLRSVRAPGREAVARKADFVEQRLGLSPGATVLDVGCGWGADVVELSTRGYLGVGLDLSLAMLSRAADEAQERGQRINFLHADMREMNFDGTFDAVMCLGTTFGYFDDDTNRQVIGRLRRALKPQGVLLLETVNRDHVIRSQPNLVWFEGDGCVCMEESEFNYFTSRLHVKRTVILDDGRQRENEYSVRLYSLHELGQMLHHQGFRVTEVSGRLAVPGVFFGQESPLLLVVAERRMDGTGKHSIPPLEEAFEDDDD